MVIIDKSACWFPFMFTTVRRGARRAVTVRLLWINVAWCNRAMSKFIAGHVALGLIRNQTAEDTLKQLEEHQ